MNASPLSAWYPSVSILSLMAGACLLLSIPASAGTECAPRVLESPTNFPMAAQLRGQKGTVLVEVAVDGGGRARDVKVLESSGYRLLDRAAVRSIREAWRFETSACAPRELPAHQVVAVEFRNGEPVRAPEGTPKLARRFLP